MFWTLRFFFPLLLSWDSGVRPRMDTVMSFQGLQGDSWNSTDPLLIHSLTLWICLHISWNICTRFSHIGLHLKTLHGALTLALFDSLAPVVAHFTRRSLCSRGSSLGTAASSRPLRTMLPGSSLATSARFGCYTRVASPRCLADTLFTFLHHSTRPSSARSRPGLCAFIIFSIHCSCGRIPAFHHSWHGTPTIMSMCCTCGTQHLAPSNLSVPLEPGITR